MGRRRRSLAGSMAGSLAGSLADRSAGGAPAFDGVLDAIAAAGGPSSPGAYLISHNVNGSYSGPSVRIRRADNNAEANIPFLVGATTLDCAIDEAAIVTHCTSPATNGFIVTNYDKSGNGRHITMATTTAQPKIYDSVTGVVKRGSLVCADFVSATGNPADRWARADRLGFSVDPSIAIFYLAKFSANAGVERIVTGLGIEAGVNYYTGRRTDNNLAIGASASGFAGGGSTNHRTFAPAADVTSAIRHYLVSRAQRGYWASPTIRQDGNLLTATSAGTAVISALGAATCGVGGRGDSITQGFDGLCPGVIYFDGLLSGDALAALMTYGDACVNLAEGAPPAAADISKVERYIVSCGQSNAANLSIPATDYAARYGDIMAKSALGGVGFQNGTGAWAPPSGSAYLALVTELNKLDPRIPFYLWLALGETDASVVGWANVFAAQMLAFDAALVAAFPSRTINWLDTYLHSGCQQPFASTVNAQKDIAGATLGSRWRIFDPSVLAGALLDEATDQHWNPTLQASCTNHAVTTINTEWPL